jgi:hypothetical protein
VSTVNVGYTVLYTDTRTRPAVIALVVKEVKKFPRQLINYSTWVASVTLTLVPPLFLHLMARNKFAALPSRLRDLASAKVSRPLHVACEIDIHTGATLHPLRPKTLSQYPALRQGAETLSQRFCERMKVLMQKTKGIARDVLQDSPGVVAQGTVVATAGAVAACRRRRD